MSEKDHELKTWPQPFQQVWLGNKTHEVRKADRDFKVADTILLREWVPRQSGAFPQTVGMDGSAYYTGREVLVEITYVSEAGTWGLPRDLCVLSIRPIERRDNREANL